MCTKQQKCRDSDWVAAKWPKKNFLNKKDSSSSSDCRSSNAIQKRAKKNNWHCSFHFIIHISILFAVSYSTVCCFWFDVQSERKKMAWSFIWVREFFNALVKILCDETQCVCVCGFYFGPFQLLNAQCTMHFIARSLCRIDVENSKNAEQ